MLDRRVATYGEAVAGLRDGCRVLLGGFGGLSVPLGLVAAVMDAGLRELTVIANNAGTPGPNLTVLLQAGRVRKLICSFPRSTSNTVFADLHRAGRVEVEVMPQGTLVERMRCASAGLGGFYTPVGAGTALAEGKESRVLGGREHALELPLRGDVTLLKARRADRFGNLLYSKAARNFSPVMATVADLVVVEADELVELGALDPECVVTPGIFVDRVVRKGSSP